MNSSDGGVHEKWSHTIRRGEVMPQYTSMFFFFSRVTVHSTKTLPLVDEEGFDVETNRATSIAFHSINYERQKQPYGICISSWNETDIGGIVTSEHGELPYTQGVRINNKLPLDNFPPSNARGSVSSKLLRNLVAASTPSCSIKSWNLRN